MKYSTREITLIAIVVAIMISVGYILYVVGSIFPGSGSKFVTMAPFLSFMLTILISKIKKVGTIFSTSLIFGGIMTFISVFMGVAIIASGILSDIITFILFRNYNKSYKIMASTALFPMFSAITSILVGNFITGNKLHVVFGGTTTVIILSICIYALGLFGSYMGLKLASLKSIKYS